ncbi:MAG: transcriptional regulator [Sphingobium sp.]|nr:transcriptional regulator [Sphingobium sp.]
MPDIMTAAGQSPHGVSNLFTDGSEVPTPQPRSYAFGAFLLQPERQFLARDGRPVRIGGRALDILAVLVARPGQVVSKRELIERVWPSLFVDESNLKTNMAVLRRTLGERHAEAHFIATVVGRGYRFICPVRTFGEGYSG